MTFREWLDKNYGEDFDPSGLTDEEYFQLEDDYYEDTSIGIIEARYETYDVL